MGEYITPEEVDALKLPKFSRAERLKKLGELAAPLKAGVPEYADFKVRNKFDLRMLASVRPTLDELKKLAEAIQANANTIREDTRFYATGVPDADTQPELQLDLGEE